MHIDRLFGTYRAPAPDEFPQTGLPEGVLDRSVLHAAVDPLLRWMRRAAVLGTRDARWRRAPLTDWP